MLACGRKEPPPPDHTFNRDRDIAQVAGHQDQLWGSRGGGCPNHRLRMSFGYRHVEPRPQSPGNRQLQGGIANPMTLTRELIGPPEPKRVNLHERYCYPSSQA